MVKTRLNSSPEIDTAKFSTTFNVLRLKNLKVEAKKVRHLMDHDDLVAANSLKYRPVRKEFAFRPEEFTRVLWVSLEDVLLRYNLRYIKVKKTTKRDNFFISLICFTSNKMSLPYKKFK